MAKELQKEENEKKKIGRIFYRTIPAVLAPTQQLELPQIKLKTADFIESIIIFFSGTACLLLLLRIVLMILGVNGGNLFTFLLYSTSYPFVFLLNSSQQQVPAMSNQTLYENIVILVIYAVVSYGLLRIIRAVQEKGKN